MFIFSLNISKIIADILNLKPHQIESICCFSNKEVTDFCRNEGRDILYNHRIHQTVATKLLFFSKYNCPADSKRAQLRNLHYRCSAKLSIATLAFQSPQVENTENRVLVLHTSAFRGITPPQQLQ